MMKYLVLALILLLLVRLGYWIKNRTPRPAGAPPPPAAAAVPGTSWYKVHTHAIKFSKDYPKIATVIGFVLLLYVLVLAFFPESWGFLLSPMGVGLLALAIAGYTAFVIIKAVFWKDSWFTAVVMILLLIAVLDMGITRSIPPERRAEIYARFGSWIPFTGNGVTTQPVFFTASQCGVEIPSPVLVSASPTLLTTGVKCQFDFKVVSGKVRVEGEGGYGHMDFNPYGLVEKNISPGWRGITIRSIEPGTKITGRFS